jgi:hypothetical protein
MKVLWYSVSISLAGMAQEPQSFLFTKILKFEVPKIAADKMPATISSARKMTKIVVGRRLTFLFSRPNNEICCRTAWEMHRHFVCLQTNSWRTREMMENNGPSNAAQCLFLCLSMSRAMVRYIGDS